MPFPLQILLPVAGLHILNVQTRVKQGRYSLIVPYYITHIRRVTAVLNEKQKVI